MATEHRRKIQLQGSPILNRYGTTALKFRFLFEPSMVTAASDGIQLNFSMTHIINDDEYEPIPPGPPASSIGIHMLVSGRTAEGATIPGATTNLDASEAFTIPVDYPARELGIIDFQTLNITSDPNVRVYSGVIYRFTYDTPTNLPNDLTLSSLSVFWTRP